MKHSFFQKIQKASLFIIINLLFTSFSVANIDAEIFNRIKPRSIGPANMSGRISDIDAVVANPSIIYIGTATGGVWKSINCNPQQYYPPTRRS